MLSFTPKFQTEGEVIAYHHGQCDALDAAIAVLERYWLAHKAATDNATLHPLHRRARQAHANGLYFALERVRYLRGGRIIGKHININQRIKAEIIPGRTKKHFHFRVRSTAVQGIND